jgi:hypothetical protein
MRSLLVITLLLMVPGIVYPSDIVPLAINNTTRYTMTLYVDGRATCTAAPGDNCVTWVSIGAHDLMASDGAGHTITYREVFKDGDQKQWNITSETRWRYVQ